MPAHRQPPDPVLQFDPAFLAGFQPLPQRQVVEVDGGLKAAVKEAGGRLQIGFEDGVIGVDGGEEEAVRGPVPLGGVAAARQALGLDVGQLGEGEDDVPPFVFQGPGVEGADGRRRIGLVLCGEVEAMEDDDR